MFESNSKSCVGLWINLIYFKTMFVENYIFKMLLCWTLAQFNLILKQFKMLLFWTLAQWALCNVHWFPWFLRTNSSMSWKVTSETFKEVVAQSTKANLNYILFVSSRKSSPLPPSLPLSHPLPVPSWWQRPLILLMPPHLKCLLCNF